MKVRFVDLIRQNQIHQSELNQVVKKTISQADFILGKKVQEFEKAFAKYCKAKYCISLNSGTDALEFALLFLDLKSGDEVITTPNTYFSTAAVILKLGLKVKFVDIDPQTYNIDPKQIKKALSSKTRAIIPVHLYGQPADMDPIVKLAKTHKLAIIEDCCQAHGALYKSKNLPYSGTGAFSFYPGKNLGCFGDGGALVTNSAKLYKLALHLRNDGAIKKYHHQIIGYKSRLDSLQAVVLTTKLKHLSKWNKLRQQHAKEYTKTLSGIKQIALPKKADYSHHVYHLFVIRTPKRNQLQKYLNSFGIETGIHYPIPIHLQKPFKDLGYKAGDFPTTEKYSRQILSLPMFPELKTTEIKYICNKIKRFFSK